MTLIRSLGKGDRLTALGAVAILIAGLVGVLVPAGISQDVAPRKTDGVTRAASAPTPQPSTESAPAVTAAIGAVTIARPVDVLGEPRAGASVVSRLGEGVLVPVTAARDGFLGVLTPCETDGWVPQDAVRVHRQAAPGLPDRFEEATFVLDAGHGGLQPGAVGPTGLTEEDANLDIVIRTAQLLSGPRTIDADGRVVDGEDYGTPRVFLTRTSPFTAGLRFRSAVANALRAHAFVSVHNNSAPDGPRDTPGTETYYQFHSPRSKRLAGLIYEEVLTAITPLGLAWVGDLDAGAKWRLNSEGTDFYGILRRSEVPTVLLEAMFISNPPEEHALRHEEVRQAIAEALYRAFVRYVTTDDPGAGFTEPYPRGSAGSSGRLHSQCVDPV